MPEEITYADAGVDREVREESKKSLRVLEETYKFSRYGEVRQLPYGNIFPVGDGCYLDLVVEGVGTKVLVAQLAGKYDTIGVDGVAMAVNDVIRSGARPLAVVDNIHAQVSDPDLVEEWVQGIADGASEAGCVVSGGEIGDVAEVVRGVEEGEGFDMVVSTVGEVSEENIISGRKITPGDTVIGLRSSGIHSNGISLARKVLFKQWGGAYDAHSIPEELDREVVYEVLEPTKLYVKPLLEVTEDIEVKAAVHITGDAYLKFNKLTMFSKGIGFKFQNFKPQPIFKLIQKSASQLGSTITEEEMFKTFNMGWGFAVIVDKTRKDDVLDKLEKTGTHAEVIGQVTDSTGVEIFHEDERIELN
ncbi:MAG: phosphoribosylformylglycinamidine cyclo-ligase [Thermoproteota archaeon]